MKTQTNLNQPDLSIVIPAYNEAARLPKNLKKLKRWLDSAGFTAEVVVVVEKSKDQTATLARRVVKDDARFKIVANKQQRGKGYAVRQGVKRASGKYVLFMDADFSTSLKCIKSFMNYFAQNPKVDVIIGSRQHQSSHISLRQNYLRQNMGRIFNFIIQQVILSGIKDTQCGFKAFTGNAARQIFSLQKFNGFAFDVELLYMADWLNHRVAVLPVTWTNSPSSKVRMTTSTLHMLKDAFVLRWQMGQKRHLTPYEKEVETAPKILEAEALNA